MKRQREEDDNGFGKWGGYMSAKITKLEEQYTEDAKNLGTAEKLSNIFEGVSIFVNGLTEPPSEVLRMLMLQHGGTYNAYETSATTHVIASNLPNAKVQQKAFARVIRPEWLIDSVAAGKLLPTNNYLFCARSALQPVLPFQPTTAEINKKVPAKTATDSNFISEFYNNSRLHHLSTMGALLKEYVGKLKDNHSGTFPGLDRLRAFIGEKKGSRGFAAQRVIMHIDMDSFFVSVALRDRPDLVGRPVAVTHARGNNVPARPGVDRAAELAIYERRAGGAIDSRFTAKGGNALGGKESMSEVASCSYEARARGVKNGMYLGKALSLCPGLVTVPYNFAAYTEVSYALYDTVAEYTLAVEAVSCDELFIDCTGVLKTTGAEPLEFASSLREDVSKRTRCPCSTGLGSNKLQARLASRKAKPNGQFFLAPEELDSFMKEIRVKDLPGVGWSTARKLKEMDIETCMDLQEVSLSTLKSQLGGKNGDNLYRFCRGIDDRPVLSEHQRKSVSAEVNYGIRFTNETEAEDFLRRLSAEVAERLSALTMRGRCLTLKLMTRSADAPTETAKFLGHGVCDSSSRSVMLPAPTSEADVIAEHILKLRRQFDALPEDMRGIGIQMSKLEGAPRAGTLRNFFLKKSTAETEQSFKGKSLVASTSEMPKVKSEDTKKTKTVLNQQASHSLSFSQLDPHVLKELPEEIQREILAAYGRENFEGSANKVESHSSKQSQITTVSNTRVPCEFIETDNVFAGLQSRELRQIVSSWVDAEEDPKEYDIKMLADYLALLVTQREIVIVQEVLSCLNRTIRKYHPNDESWLSVYRSIVDIVQVAMVEVYCYPLLVCDI